MESGDRDTILRALGGFGFSGVEQRASGLGIRSSPYAWADGSIPSHNPSTGAYPDVGSRYYCPDWPNKYRGRDNDREKDDTKRTECL